METKSLSFEKLEGLSGGSACGTVSGIGMLACTGASFWPIGTAIFGPTCVGMAVGVFAEC